MKKAFTLVELLVVVLIIGILTAVALPMYQGAVDKSHWSTMLPGAKAIKDAEEAIRMTNGSYTDEMENLDVTMNNEDLTFNLITPNNMSDPNVIRVASAKLDNVRLASYLNESPMFAGQLHCEAKTGDDRATRLCEKLLGGQELTSTDGYKGYLLDQDIDKATCDNASRSWSSSKTKCYKDIAARCEALGMPVLNAQDNSCGYTNKSGNSNNRVVVETEGECIGQSSHSCIYDNFDQGVCQANAYATCRNNKYESTSTCKGDNGASCIDSQFKSGSVCEGNVGTACSRSQFYDGGVCIANVAGTCTYRDYANMVSTFDSGAMCVGNAANTCSTGLTLKEGAICIANASGACNADYSLGACCCGNHCPNGAPRCDDSVCSNSKYVK